MKLSCCSAALFIWEQFSSQKTFFSQKFLLTNKAHNASFMRAQREEGEACRMWRGKNMESLHNHFEFHNKQQKSNLRTCKKYCTHAMQHATNPSTLPSLFLSQLLPLSICRKVCSSLGQQNGIRISGRTHKKRCSKREENVKGKREGVRDMEKLLWFY